MTKRRVLFFAVLAAGLIVFFSLNTLIAKPPPPKPTYFDYKATFVNQSTKSMLVRCRIFMPSHGWVVFQDRTLNPSVGYRYELSHVEDASGTYAKYDYTKTGEAQKTIKQNVTDMKAGKTIYAN